MTQNQIEKPEILAPAGGRAAFLAALAAGADAVYCGLKQFSARMAAENFTVEELASLAALAREKQAKTYVALNTMLKPDELDSAGDLIDRLNRKVRPEALIVSDTAMISLAAQVGYKGDIHLSTLANVSFPDAMKVVAMFPQVNRVVIPRELNIDEIRMMAEACPSSVSLEVFVHGALCYAVSGRCYWSSYLGGKSGLRGNCVQPCRRVYSQEDTRARLFSCQDLWLDVLARVLVTVPGISALKIEGRKKGPHYVYYTVKAYCLLRDNPGDNEAKKSALSCLEYAMGRGGTHYHFLPQRPWSPIDINSQTASGQLIGKIQGTMVKPYIEPRVQLFAKDVLRIGYEDESWHRTLRVTKSVPKRGRLFLNMPKKARAVNKTPVFLIDRKEPDLLAEIEVLEKQLESAEPDKTAPLTRFKVDMPDADFPKSVRVSEMHVGREVSKPPSKGRTTGLWIEPNMHDTMPRYPGQIWCWLPPVIWPDNQAEFKVTIDHIIKKGFTQFVINAPWQMAFFPAGKGLIIWAGPFCNTANALAIDNLAKIGCHGIIVSPELGQKDYLDIAATTPLPLGVVIYGNWPLCISRIKSESLKTDIPFASPKKEYAWAHKHGDNYWIYPEWPVDLRDYAEALKKAGYETFVHLHEKLPGNIQMKKRPGKWNWDIGLK